MTQSEFLEKAKAIKNIEEARLLLSVTYPTSVKSTDDFYTTSGVEDLGWDTFYVVREIEEKFVLGNFASSYIATSLAFPKISKMYASIAANCGQDKGDFCSKVLENISSNVIPKWDKSKNDNFFAYLLPNLRTTYNEMLEGDDGPSKYYKEKKGLSLTSIEAMNENSEVGFEVQSGEDSVEDQVIDKIAREDRSLLKRIINIENEDKIDSENIWNSIVCQKLFNTDKNELTIVDDRRIAKVLELYFKAIDAGKIPGVKAVTKTSNKKDEIVDIEEDSLLEDDEEDRYLPA